MTSASQLFARTTATALACLVLAPALASAAAITLAAKSGGFDIEGDLKSFDGITYVIETAAGPMSLPAASYTCVSDLCPKTPLGSQTAAAALTTTPLLGDAQRIVIQGSSTIGRELMPDLIRSFAASRRQKTEDVVGGQVNETEIILAAADAHAKTSVALAVHGSKSGIVALTSGEATFAMVDRMMTADEQTKVRTARSQVIRTDVLGIDGIVVVVGSAVGARVLSAQQIARLFAGQVSNWSELGFAAGPVTLYAPDYGQGTLDVFVDGILKPYGLTLAPSVVHGGSHAERMRKLERDPFGISFVSLTTVDQARAVDITLNCGLTAKPTRFALKVEEYPLSRRLNLYSASVLEPAAEALAGFVTSSAGQKLVASHGFVDQNVDAVPFTHEQGRLSAPLRSNAPAQEVAARAQALADLKGYKRLSATVRFASSTSTVDARSRQELERLAVVLKTPEYRTKTVLLAGFTDPVGTLSVNIGLAKKRAEQVRSLVLARAEGGRSADTVLARGYGPAAPVACNDTAEGQMRNRRVEVWVKE